MAIWYQIWAGSSPPSLAIYDEEIKFRRAALWPNARNDENICYDHEDAETSTHVSALDNETLIGSVLFIVAPHCSKDEAEVAGRLCQMAVAGSHQGQGIGRELVQKLEVHLQKIWVRPVKVKVHAQVHAVGFYQKLGYEVSENKADFLDDGIWHRYMHKTIMPL